MISRVIEKRKTWESVTNETNIVHIEIKKRKAKKNKHKHKHE